MDECAVIDGRDFDGIHMPKEFEVVRKRIEEFKCREEDIWVTSYSKCGTTWTQEMVWLICNDLNYDGAKKHLEIRFPFIEYSAIAAGCGKFIRDHGVKTGFSDDRTFPDPVKLLDDDPSNPRFIKSHLPWEFLPRGIVNGTEKPKIVHVLRNPKQVVPSYYHHSVRVFPMFKGTLPQFVDSYIKGNLLYGDYFTTAMSYWRQRRRDNLLLLTYEEMHADLPRAIRKTAEFFGKSYDEREVAELAAHLSFDAMKRNRAVNKSDFVKNEEVQFLRKGSADSYKEELTGEMIGKLDSWIAERTKGEKDFPYASV